MYFEDIRQAQDIILKTNCVVLVLGEKDELRLRNALVLEPEKDKKYISVSQVRDFTALVNTKQVADQFLVIRPADAMNIEAQNAFLKNLEEPQEYCHYVLVTDKPSLLLPTILSRAQIYFLKKEPNIDKPPAMDEETKRLAKMMIAGKPGDLAEIAEIVNKIKDTGKRRERALELVVAAIELLYKSFFVTGKVNFVARIPAFLELYENLQKNGHVKLHLVADLV